MAITGMDPSLLHEELRAHPVIAVLYGPDSIPNFLRADARVCLLANIELRRVPGIVRALRENRRQVILNLDTIAGLAQDRAGVAFLKDVGVGAVVTTRGSLVSRIKSLGLFAVQKVFVTDRSNLPRALESVRNAQPDLVQLMPAPMLGHLDAEARQVFAPFIASGFIDGRDGVAAALRNGAVGVSSQTQALWHRKNLIQGV